MNKNLVAIGTILKPHGLKGSLLVKLSTNCLKERTKNGIQFYLGTDEEFLTVNEAKPSSNEQKWYFDFLEINDRDHAATFAGKTIYAEKLDDGVFVDDLIGKTVIDQHDRSCGTISSILVNPASDLLELQDGQLIPMNFFIKISEDIVYVEIPEGLIE